MITHRVSSFRLTMILLTLVLSVSVSSVATVYASSVIVTPNPVTQGSSFEVSGSGYTPHEWVDILLYPGTCPPTGPFPGILGSSQADASGAWGPITVSPSPPLALGTYCLQASDGFSLATPLVVVAPGPVSMTVSYSIVGRQIQDTNANPAAPVFHYVLNTLSKSLTLSRTPKTVSVDVDSTWSVTPNPLIGSTSSERWQSNQDLSGTASSTTIVFVFYHQTLQRLSYSVSGGGTGYLAPDFEASQFGSTYTVTLATSATKDWFDCGSTWKVTNPLAGSTDLNERWFTTQKTSGVILNSGTLVFKYQHQFYLTMVASGQTESVWPGSVTPASGWKNAGSTVTITAKPNTGSIFTGWTGTGDGSYTGPNRYARITMNSAITETAVFA